MAQYKCATSLSKGQQTVRVERVTVESGGQAIVGNVSKGRA